jgi:hypothetical protein
VVDATCDKLSERLLQQIPLVVEPGRPFRVIPPDLYRLVSIIPLAFLAASTAHSTTISEPTNPCPETHCHAAYRVRGRLLPLRCGQALSVSAETSDAIAPGVPADYALIPAEGQPEQRAGRPHLPRTGSSAMGWLGATPWPCLRSQSAA